MKTKKPNTEKPDIEKSFFKVKLVLYSCTNISQLLIGINMITCFMNMYSSAYRYNEELLYLGRLRVKQLGY